MVAKVIIRHSELVIDKEIKFPSLEAANVFINWFISMYDTWYVSELVLSDDEEFTFEGSVESQELLLNTAFKWQLRSNTPSLGQVKLPDTGEWELWLM
jgi:hypothetical protein